LRYRANAEPENERRLRQRTATIRREQTEKNATNVFKMYNNINVLGPEHLVDIEGVTGSIPVAPTIQSYETAHPGAGSRWAVSAGIFAGIIPLFRSLVTLAVSQADF
jgi:hypothetical protein